MEEKDQSNAHGEGNDLPIPPTGKETNSNANLAKSETQNTPNLQKPPKPRWFRDRDKRESTLIVVTLVLAFCTGWMAWETHQLTSDSRERTQTELRAYVAIVSPKLDIEHRQATYIIENFGKTPAYRIEMDGEFGYRDTIINTEQRFPLDTAWHGFNLFPNVPSLQYTKFMDSTGNRLVLYGRIHYLDRFGRWHFTSYGFQYEFRIHEFTVYPKANDAD
jgi:hypothetical protein